MALATSKNIASLAVGLLSRAMILGGTVARIPATDYRGKSGGTVTVPVPQPGAARTQASRSADITYDDTSEVPVDVSLDHLYHARLISDEEATLDLADFGQQVLPVQVDAVATGVEDAIAAVLNGLTPAASVAANGSDVDAVLRGARAALTKANVPPTNRFLAVSPDFGTFMLGLDKFVAADKTGSPSALRDATLGRIYGLQVVESSRLTDGIAVAYHRSGVVLGNVAPVAPKGARESSTVTVGGFSMRHVWQYETSKLSDASVLSTLAGSSLVEAARTYAIDTSV